MKCNLSSEQAQSLIDRIAELQQQTQRDAATITRLRAEVEGERENKEAARERWIECQARLTMLEQLAISKTGIEQATEDNIEHMAHLIVGRKGRASR